MATKIVNGKEFPLTDAEEKALLDRKAKSEANESNLCLESIRRERNKRLQETDYFALNDVTLTDSMKSYRATLRDLPANISDSVAFQTQWNEFEQGKAGVSDPWPNKP
tara:strand:+ start:508 stop:831 length:324 start_codon:yes stop_codon:yes gene_type:complete